MCKSLLLNQQEKASHGVYSTFYEIKKAGLVVELCHFEYRKKCLFLHFAQNCPKSTLSANFCR